MKSDNIHRASNIEFLITNACNLRCKYCFMSENLGKDKANIESIKKYLKEGGNKDTYVFGGEPLVNIHGIIELIEYVETLDLKNKQEILKTLRKQTTNGTLIEKYLDLIKKYKFELQISLDGDREANSERVRTDGSDSFDDVLKGVRLCVEHSIPYSVHGVLTPKNALRYSSLIKFLYELMLEDKNKDPVEYFKGNFSMFAFEGDYTDEFINKFLVQLEETTRWIISLDIPEEKKQRLFHNVISRTDLYGVCGAGTGLKTVDNNNLLYPCHRSILKEAQVAGNLFDSNTLKNIDLYNSFHELKWDGYMYSSWFLQEGLRNKKDQDPLGWSMWCPSTNLETSEDVTFINAKYSVVINEVNKFTKYLKEQYRI